MRNLDYKSLDIKPHQIMFAMTSEPDYEMYRYILLQTGYDTYVVLYGSHCSCYDFDETMWEATEYTRDELKKLALAPYNRNVFWHMVRSHFGIV